MEVLEPLWFTITTVHDIVKSHKELASELNELAETVKLITIAVRPLNNTKEQDEIEEVMLPIRAVLLEADKLLKELSEEKKNAKSFLIFNLFRPQNYLEEIRGYREKLNHLTPILTLAINSIQHKKTVSTVSTSIGNDSLKINGGPHSFSAAKLLQHDKARSFWAQHFGDQMYKVAWSRFLAAYEHEFSTLLKGQSVDLDQSSRILKIKLDRNGDHEVDVYEWDLFTREKGPIDSLLHFLKDPLEVEAVSKKRKPTYEEGKENYVDNIPLSKKQKDDTALMPPPSSPVSISDLTLKEGEQAVYQLILFGKEDIIKDEGFKDLRLIQRPWHSEPLCIGRSFFADIPSEMLVRISRQHFEISCVTNVETNQREFWLTDTSGNGTFVNGKLVGKSNKVSLSNDDKVGILMQKPQLKEVEIGYHFKVVAQCGSLYT